MESVVIDRILKKNCSIYLGVYASDELPVVKSTRHVIVVNTDPASRPGKHWICMYFDGKGRGEYFDSFGLPPKRTFKSYLDKHCTSWTFNNKRMQSVVSKFCGHYCIWYCMMKNRNVVLRELVKTMTNDTGLNDFLVHRFACRF